jgi:hypothetical protein
LLESSCISVLVMMSGSVFIQSYVSVDPYIDKAFVGVDYCIPHLVDASFIPSSHGSFQYLSFSGCIAQSYYPLTGCDDV